jgi:hypothetical protein
MKENIKDLLEHGYVIVKLRFYKGKSTTIWIYPRWVKENYFLFSTYEPNRKVWYEYYLIPRTHSITKVNINKKGMLIKNFKSSELQVKPKEFSKYFKKMAGGGPS